MKPVINLYVVEAWVNDHAARNHRGSFTTDGKRIWSYKLLIGDTDVSGKKVLRDYSANGLWPYKTQTTSCHVGLARPHADVVS